MYQKFIEESLKKASQIASSNFNKVSGISKGDDNNQVLTQTDIEVGKLLVDLLQKEFPTYNVIDEETGVFDKNSEFTWVIDPIDGTSNYAVGVPNYGTMIGLLKDDKPIAGGISLPFYHEICIAEKSQGAFCNGEKLSVTKEKDLLSVLVAYQIDGHQENPDFTRKEGKVFAEIALNIRNLRNSGTVCFDGIMVAKGKYGAYLIQTGKLWDVVALNVIIEESGGIYTQYNGKPTNYVNAMQRTKENFGCCASTPALHAQLQKVIHSVKG